MLLIKTLQNEVCFEFNYIKSMSQCRTFSQGGIFIVIVCFQDLYLIITTSDEKYLEVTEIAQHNLVLQN